MNLLGGLALLGIWASAIRCAPDSVEGQQIVLSTNDTDSTNSHATRIAIIGAGSAGASTAYFLRQYWTEAQSEYGLPDLDITVFERNSYIGGRSTTVAANDEPSQPVELGASIFVSVNHNLVNAMHALNLSASSLLAPTQNSVPDMGIWNGHEFVLTLDRDVGYWDYARLYWRYGLAPLKTIRLMKATVAKFLKIYDQPFFPFRSLSDVVQALGLLDVTAVTGAEYLAANGIKGLFGPEVVQASTRVNYAQSLGTIHGLEAMVCMATDGAMSIAGGNWRIFAGMLQVSKAHVKLNHAVEEVSRLSTRRGWELSYQDMENFDTDMTETFDTVVLAGPKQFSGIEFAEPLEHEPDQIPYVRLHVTLFTSVHELDPAAFGLVKGVPVPLTVLTTLPTTEADAAPGPDFLSISRLRNISVKASNGTYRTEHVYKIFTLEPVTYTFLAQILGLPTPHDEEEQEQWPSKDDVSWLYRKEWDSYPYEYPRITFEEISLSPDLWYTSGIESFISTMETSSLMGMNVARLIVDERIGERMRFGG